MKSYLEFEHDIKGLEEELEKLKDPFNKEGLSEVETDKISQIQREIDDKLKASYANLNAWQRTQVGQQCPMPLVRLEFRISRNATASKGQIENFKDRRQRRGDRQEKQTSL